MSLRNQRHFTIHSAAMSGTGRPPLLLNHTISKLLIEYFSFKTVNEVTIKSFPSYYDRNFYFVGEHLGSSSGVGEEYVLKIINPRTTCFKTIKEIVEVMKHLSLHGLSIPHPLDSRNGHVIQLSREELLSGRDDVGSSPSSTYADNDPPDLLYPVYVLSFISGQTLDKIEKKYLTPALLQEIGSYLGRIDLELTDFVGQPSVSQLSDNWNLMHFLDMKKYLQDNDDPKTAEYIIKCFECHVSPRIPSFKRSIIHGDLNALNIIVKKHQHDDSYYLAGIIDFNDCVKTNTIFDLAICVASLMETNIEPKKISDTVEFVGPLIGGYNSVLPLTPDELDSLYYLVLARSLQCSINTSRDFKLEPWNTYIVSCTQNSLLLINELISTSKDQVNIIWGKYV